MMSFPGKQWLLLIAFLSIIITARESSSTDLASNQHPLLWRSILRDFVFKTLSSPRYQDYDLWKKLQDAPFFDGPFPATSKGDNSLVSRGNVYKVSENGQWILCQEGCTRCDICDRQNGDPAVKWILRRVKRLTSSSSSKWDLWLTVVRQKDKNNHPWSYNDDKARVKDAGELSSSSTQQEFALLKAHEMNSWVPNKIEGYSDGLPKEGNNYRRNSAGSRRYRSKRRPSFKYYDQDLNEAKNLAERFQNDMSPRVIVGIDQHGKKHIIHLVPVDSSMEKSNLPNNNVKNYRSSDKWGNSARISRTIQRDEPSYDKLIGSVLDSFDTHRNFIEKFLYSDRLEPVNHNHAAVSSLTSTYPGLSDERIERRYLEGNIDDSRQANQYLPSDSEYQVEQGEQLRRYVDMTREANKPSGEYQEQNTMIEYEPYGVSADGQQQQQQEQQELQQQQQQQQHQGDRSLPVADVERKRRNSFAKLMDSTLGHQVWNRTQTDVSDTEVSIKHDFLENSTHQKLPDMPIKINETNPPARNLPDVLATLDMQTLNSDS